MNGISLVLATLALGVDYGWQHTADGQLEYIVQIEPVTLVALGEGQEVESQIHPFVRPLRRFRIHVGTEALPRPSNRQAPANAAPTATAAQLPPDQFGWQPIDNEQTEFIIQIAPARLNTLRRGEDIVGEVPAEAGNVARVRIRAGNDRLPRSAPQRTAAPVVTTSGTTRPNEAAPLLPSAAYANQPQTQPGTAAGTRPTNTNANTGLLPSPQLGPPEFNNPVAGQNNPQANGWARDGTVSATASAGSLPRNDQYAPAPLMPQAGGTYPPNYTNTRDNYAGAAQPPTAAAARGTNPAPAASAPAATGSWWNDWFSNDAARNLVGTAAGMGTGQYPAADPRGWSAVPSPQNPAGWANAPRAEAPAPANPAGGYVDPRDPRSGYAQPTWPNMYSNPAPPPSPTAMAGYSNPNVNPNAVYPGGVYPNGAAPTQPGYDPSGARVASRDTNVRPGTNPTGQVPPNGPPNANPAANDDFWKQMNQSANNRTSPYPPNANAGIGDGNKPWGPLMLTVLALFASIGANVYMGTVVARTYWKYMDLASEVGEEDRRELRLDRDDDSRTERRTRAAA